MNLYRATALGERELISFSGGVLKCLDLSLRNDGRIAINATGGTDITIDRCIFWYSGIHIDGTAKMWIRDNWIENYEQGPAIYAEPNPNLIILRIQGNYILNCKNAISLYKVSYYGAGNRVTIDNNEIYKSTEHGIFISRCYAGILITNNIFLGNGDSVDNTFDHIYLDRASFVTIHDNKFGTTATPKTRYAIYFLSRALEVQTYTSITDNDFLYCGKSATLNPAKEEIYTNFYTQVSGQIYIGVNNTKISISNNIGYVTENGGTATLLNGDTTVEVAHELSYTPTAGDIMVTPIESLGASGFWWVNGLNATHFIINLDQDPTQDVDFAWSASRN